MLTHPPISTPQRPVPPGPGATDMQQDATRPPRNLHGRSRRAPSRKNRGACASAGSRVQASSAPYFLCFHARGPRESWTASPASADLRLRGSRGACTRLPRPRGRACPSPPPSPRRLLPAAPARGVIWSLAMDAPGAGQCRPPDVLPRGRTPTGAPGPRPPARPLVFLPAFRGPGREAPVVPSRPVRDVARPGSPRGSVRRPVLRPAPPDPPASGSRAGRPGRGPDRGFAPTHCGAEPPPCVRGGKALCSQSGPGSSRLTSARGPDNVEGPSHSPQSLHGAPDGPFPSGLPPHRFPKSVKGWGALHRTLRTSL